MLFAKGTDFENHLKNYELFVLFFLKIVEIVIL
jgi:hypothetical protein